MLDKILLFEKTPCPFKRAFTIVLPERPQTPVKKRPWTPVRRAVLQLPPTPITPVPVSKQSLVVETERRSSAELDRATEKERLDEDVLAPIENQRGETVTNETDAQPLSDRLLPSLPGKSAGFQASRSLTAPPQLSLNISPPSKSVLRTPVDPISDNTEPSSPADSSDSFHSVQSWHSPIASLPPSPPLSNPGSPETYPNAHSDIVLPKRPTTHQRDVSDTTVTPVPDGTWELGPTGTDDSPEPSATYLDVDCSQSGEASASEDNGSTSTAVTSRPRIRHRATTSTMSVSTHRALSPLPPGANLITPHRQFSRYNSSSRASTRLEAIQRIPGAIIHKTCEVLLAPSSQLIALMLRVAARIAAGEWRGFVFGTGDTGERIPVEWDYSDDPSNSWQVDDDYSMSGLNQSQSGRRSSSHGEGDQEGNQDTEWSHSWEVD